MNIIWLRLSQPHAQNSLQPKIDQSFRLIYKGKSAHDKKSKSTEGQIQVSDDLGECYSMFKYRYRNE